MQLSKRTLEELRNIINGDGTPDYRKGYQLVQFFNDLGFNDKYGQGFPSRWVYTDEKLESINGTPELDKCIKKTFSVIDYVGRIDQLDALIAHFNQYLAFDKWQVVRDNDVITFCRKEKIIVESPQKNMAEENEDAFLSRTFDVDINQLGLSSGINDIISLRLKEAEACVKNNAPLASVIMIGSILEGILLGTAAQYPQKFNQVNCAPKDAAGAVRRFPDWPLNNFIDAASEVGLLRQDVKKFSHVVRDFRNYIHPYSQMNAQFTPDKHTALICLQVLKAAICQIGEYRKALQGGTN